MPFFMAARGREFSSRETPALGVVVAQRQRAIQQAVHVHFVFYDLADGERIALLNEIAPAQFVGGDADGGGDAIEVALEGEDALWRAEAAKRAVRRRVGGHGAAVNAHVAGIDTARRRESCRARGPRAKEFGTRRRQS